MWVSNNRKLENNFVNDLAELSKCNLDKLKWFIYTQFTNNENYDYYIKDCFNVDVAFTIKMKSECIKYSRNFEIELDKNEDKVYQPKTRAMIKKKYKSI
jgi:hypothetical protein